MKKTEFSAHESSYIDEGAEIGENTKIWHFSHIMSGAKIGSNCNIGQNVVVASNVVIGNGVKIQNNVSVYDGVICEDDVFLGPSCVFTNVINPRSAISRKLEYRETKIKKGASIGANSTIICGHNIGRYALVGAGSTVTKNIPDHACVTGSPAKLLYYVCECGNKLYLRDDKYICKNCGKEYVMKNNEMKEFSWGGVNNFNIDFRKVSLLCC